MQWQTHRAVHRAVQVVEGVGHDDPTQGVATIRAGANGKAATPRSPNLDSRRDVPSGAELPAILLTLC